MKSQKSGVITRASASCAVSWAGMNTDSASPAALRSSAISRPKWSSAMTIHEPSWSPSTRSGRGVPSLLISHMMSW